MKAFSLFKVSAFIFLLSATLLLGGCGEECSHKYMSESETKPTHDKEGYTTYTCMECDYTYKSDFIAPLGHAMRKEVHTPTCTDEGYTYNYCDCGYHFSSDIIPPTGHVMSTEEIIPPACTSIGRTVSDCTVCGHHFETPIAPLAHDLQIGARTYLSVDSQISSVTYTCSRCDLNYKGDHLFYHDIYRGAYVENTAVLAKGLDVSYHQHDQNASGEYLPLNWNAIKAAGYDFAILRAGYMGTGNVGVTDKVYEMNYRDARAAGLDLGVYFYSYAYSVDDAEKEAEFLLTLLEGKTFEYPIFFDLEDPAIAAKNLSASELTDICTTFINILQKNGYYSALYINDSWLKESLDTQKVTTMFDIWYARYKSDTDTIIEDVWNTENFGKQMAMWQFSKTGIIDGIVHTNGKNVTFDMNYAYKDYPTLIKGLGLNGFGIGAA